MIAQEALVQVAKLLDDQDFVHADPDVALRMLSRAHQYVALRYRLILETVPLDIVANQPLYRLQSVVPEAVGIDTLTNANGRVVWPQPLAHIRQGDTQWLATTSDDGPIWRYRIGLSWFGLYPVPALQETFQLTVVKVPNIMVTVGDHLLVPDAYLPSVIMLTAGFLMIASERAHQQGIGLVMKSLGVETAT